MEAGCGRAGAVLGEARRGGQRGTDGVVGGCEGLGGDPVGVGGGEVDAVKRRKDTSDDHYPEGAAKLAGGVVDGGSHASGGVGGRAHQRLGGRGAVAPSLGLYPVSGRPSIC